MLLRDASIAELTAYRGEEAELWAAASGHAL